jgi:hypothetical protein
MKEPRMIAPKIVSHVQPAGRDYSGTTSPDLITAVPGPADAASVTEAGRVTVGALILSAAGIAAALLLLALTIAVWPTDGPNPAPSAWTHGNFR